MQKIIFWNTGSLEGNADRVDHGICILPIFYLKIMQASLETDLIKDVHNYFWVPGDKKCNKVLQHQPQRLQLSPQRNHFGEVKLHVCTLNLKLKYLYLWKDRLKFGSRFLSTTLIFICNCTKRCSFRTIFKNATSSTQINSDWYSYLIG